MWWWNFSLVFVGRASACVVASGCKIILETQPFQLLGISAPQESSTKEYVLLKSNQPVAYTIIKPRIVVQAVFPKVLRRSS
jgi:hypothetical protein